MFLLALFLFILVLWVERSFYLSEPLENPNTQNPIAQNEIVPIAFPDQGQIKIPSNVQPQNGPLQVLGPVKLGIDGDRYMNFSTEPGKATIAFMNNGQQAVLETTGGTGKTDGNLRIQSSNLTLQGPVSIQKRLDAPKARFDTLKVNRSDADPSWGTGIHTWDLYANGRITVGANGQEAAYLDQNGNIRSNGTAQMNQITANRVDIRGRDILGELNRVQNELNNVRNRVNQYKFIF